MALLEFEDIKFRENGKEVRAYFLKNFYFDIEQKELDKLGKWHLKDESLEIEGSESIVRRNFSFLLEQKMQELYSMQENPATYVYEGLIPLIGSLYFGIMDRSTNIIEMRPITGCNLNCIFCSVDMEKGMRDFVVNVDYLVKEFEKLAALKLKEVSHIEAHINAQGEPLLYSPIVELVRKVSKIKGVDVVSIDTNGTLLTKELIDDLVDAGLTRFNVSLNSFNQKVANKLSERSYPLNNVIDMCKYIAKKSQLLLAPVWLKGINDEDIEDVIKFGLSIGAKIIGVQNFLEYRCGKNPIKQQSWEDFYSLLERLEKRYKTKLILSREDFKIEKAIVLKKPFKKDSFVEAEIVCDGRFEGEKLAKAGERAIVIPSCKKTGKVRVKITRDKYNVFYGKLV